VADFDQEAYQPIAGDICIQEGRSGRFKVYVYLEQRWEQFGRKEIGTFSEQTVQELIAPPTRFMGESECKGKKRQYYRYEETNEWVPQFPDGSGWDLEDKESPYFYEHISLQDVEKLKAASANQVYKIVTIAPTPIEYHHKDTHFIKGSYLDHFLEAYKESSDCAAYIVSIEPVDHAIYTRKVSVRLQRTRKDERTWIRHCLKSACTSTSVPTRRPRNT
jgi:hypothetical protein